MEMTSRKIQEQRALAAARSAGAPIPLGEIPDEEPDFRFATDTGDLGIEVSELVRPASTNFGIIPAEEENFHRELVLAGEKIYYGTAGAIPVHVSTCFENTRGQRQNKQKMARDLAEFVQANVGKAYPAASFYGKDVPDGFNSITIFTDLPERSDWWCGECGGYTVSDIRLQLSARISAKNRLVQKYRSNMKAGAAVWLLLYSDSSVARGMSIPFGIDQWEFQFDFDRVFWFTSLERRVVEMKQAKFPTTAVNRN